MATNRKLGGHAATSGKASSSRSQGSSQGQNGTITVATSVDTKTKRVAIRISDGGKGISENHLKKVYQPYFTTKKGKKGLGLSIAKRAFDLHHGFFSIASSKNQGTTCTILLPV